MFCEPGRPQRLWWLLDRLASPKAWGEFSGRGRWRAYWSGYDLYEGGAAQPRSRKERLGWQMAVRDNSRNHRGID